MLAFLIETYLHWVTCIFCFVLVVYRFTGNVATSPNWRQMTIINTVSSDFEGHYLHKMDTYGRLCDDPFDWQSNKSNKPVGINSMITHQIYINHRDIWRHLSVLNATSRSFECWPFLSKLICIEWHVSSALYWFNPGRQKIFPTCLKKCCLRLRHQHKEGNKQKRNLPCAY